MNGDGEPGGVGQKENASFPAKKRLKSGSKLPVMITDQLICRIYNQFILWHLRTLTSWKTGPWGGGVGGTRFFRRIFASIEDPAELRPRYVFGHCGLSNSKCAPYGLN